MISIRYPGHRWWEYSKVSARSGQFDQIPNSQNRFSRKSLAAREENLPLDHRRQRVNHTRRCNTVMKTLAFSHPIGSQSNTVVEKERPSGIPTAVVGVKFPSGLHAVQSFDQEMRDCRKFCDHFQGVMVFCVLHFTFCKRKQHWRDKPITIHS